MPAIRQLFELTLRVGSRTRFSCEKSCSSSSADRRKKRTTSTVVLFSGGRGWIRTTESGAGRFTVCSLWPLGNPSILYQATQWVHFLRLWTSVYRREVRLAWSRRWESNPQPTDYKSVALPLSYFGKNGASRRNRTTDTEIFSLLLYRLSYRG